MKKGRLRVLSLLLCLTALFIILGGCGKKEEPSSGGATLVRPGTSSEQQAASAAIGGDIASAIPRKAASVYEDVLQDYYDALYADWYEPLTADKLMEMGLCPLLADLHDADKADFGYCLSDLNGDGTDELLLGCNIAEYVDTIYAFYTAVNGEPSLIFLATDWDALYLREDGTLLREGSDET